MYTNIELLYQTTIDRNPECWLAHNNLGNVLEGRGQIDEAIAHYKKALEIKPNYAEAHNNLAWVLATCPKPSLRNGAAAVALAEGAAKLSGRQEPEILDTLAAAYAEAGRFSEAVQTAQKALDLARQQNKQTLAESIQAKIRLYEAGTPFHELQQSSPSRPVRP